MKPKRIQRKRTKGWKMPENTVYVGRPTKWGNPFNTKEAKEHWHTCDSCEDMCNDCAVSLYRTWLEGGHWSSIISVLKNIPELKGKDLACWCRLDQPCHADILLEIANA